MTRAGEYVAPLWDEVRRFCPKCGAAIFEVRRAGRGFGWSGEPNMQGRWRCPKRRHILDGHHDSGWMGLIFMPPRPAPPPSPTPPPARR